MRAPPPACSACCTSARSPCWAPHHHGTDESAPYRRTGDIYSDSKIDSERVVQQFARRGAVETVILRPGFVYGPGDHQFLPRLLDALASGQFVYAGDGSKLLNVIHVEDLVSTCAIFGDVAHGGSHTRRVIDRHSSLGDPACVPHQEREPCQHLFYPTRSSAC
ncbi:MAG: NAD-dependent epimerase/dehydratase family protein [Dehalococcoidia bacterium]